MQDGCDYTSKTTRIDLKWLESSNNGATFAPAQALASSSVAGKYFVLYNRWTANYTNYRLYLSTGLS